MYCPKCGTYSDNDNNWCVRCGYSFSNIPESLRGGNGKAEEAVKTEKVVEPDAVHPEYKTEQHSSETETEKPVYTEPYQNSEYKTRSKPVKNRCVKDYFIQSILVAILCSVAFGAASVIFSGMTQAEAAAGNLRKAEIYSRKTRMFCFIALAIGIAKYFFIAVLLISVLFNMAMPIRPYYF